MWNSIAVILFVAMMVVLATFSRIMFVEHSRKKFQWYRTELIVFGITGLTVIAALWIIFAVQWLRL